MARKTKPVVIEADGRDKGKTFLITEMGALQAEKWARRALLALCNKNVDIPPDIVHRGIEGLLRVGFSALSGLDYEKAEPLFDEMLACVEIVPDPGKNPGFKRAPTMEGDIEEVATILRLRGEVWELHTGFSLAALSQRFSSDAA
jgi:hypothetical protein